jgi:hypothetical protein
MTTRMPGFTATAGIDAGSPGYRRQRDPRDHGPTGYLPQARLGTLQGGRRGQKPCNPNCVCITAEGCPCCYPGPSIRRSGPNIWRLR